MTNNAAYALAIALIAATLIACIAIYSITRPEDEEPDPVIFDPSLDYGDDTTTCEWTGGDDDNPYTVDGPLRLECTDG